MVMGQLDVERLSPATLRSFMQRLLGDVRALEQMLSSGMIESGCCRIGCEQEMFLVDDTWNVSPIALEILDRLADPHFTTELGRFNLEINLDPMAFEDDCLSKMEAELHTKLRRVREAAREMNAEVVLTGILPTLRKSDLGLDHMTPKQRYVALNEAIARLRGGGCEFRLDGADELIVKHDSVMLEACCTSFQVHYQTDPDTFPQLYNTAQAITAPLLAAACNSPLLFGRRLWQETRIPLFQQAVDTRHATSSLRERSPRVSFGRQWLKRSVVELFQEDIARFRVLLDTKIEEDAVSVLRRSEVPRLQALQIHNGTVYRWNRPCYGLTCGKPHLRIENRVLAAGPTVLDEVANAAFFYGLLRGMTTVFPDITTVMDFDDVHTNFTKAAQEGLMAVFRWVGGRSANARDLILEELVDIAHTGLASANIRQEDSDRYLGVIRERVSSWGTGAQWMIQSLANMRGARRDSSLAALTAAMVRRQWDNAAPAHEWPLASLEEGRTMKRDKLRIEQSMTTNLFTIHPDETVELVTNLMDWNHIRHVPVENDEGSLVGLVSYFEVLRHFNKRGTHDNEPVAVRSIMNDSPLTAPPEMLVQDAIALMAENRADCLLVMKDDRLVGIVTEHDILRVAADLLA
jgi:CBS domain-containing protein/gamma-glutamyl:cysteine ligase YbdK (ATP-grasp superfamily)